MTEEEWFRPKGSHLGWLRTSGKQRASARKIGLFCAACVRRVISASNHNCLEFAVELAEHLADGTAAESDWTACRTKLQSLRPANLEWPQSQIWSLPEYAFRAIVGRPGGMSPEKRALEVCGVCAGVFHNVRDNSGSSQERAAQTDLLRDIVGNPFRPAAFSSEWRTSTAIAIGQGMYDSRDFGAMPILADALQDAGCDNDGILYHCRDPRQVHVRGCWVVDLVLGKS